MQSPQRRATILIQTPYLEPRNGEADMPTTIQATVVHSIVCQWLYYILLGRDALTLTATPQKQASLTIITTSTTSMWHYNLPSDLTSLQYLCQYDKGRSWNGTASHIKPECIVNEWEGCNECDDKPGKSKWLHVWQYTTLYPRLPCRDEPCCSPTAPSVCGPAREDICVSPCLLSAPCRTARSTPTPALLVGAIFTNSCCGNGYSTVRGRQNNIFVIGLD